MTQERTVQTGIPEQYHEDSDTLLRLSEIEYGQTRATRLDVSQVTKHGNDGTIPHVRYSFLVESYSNFVPKMSRFSDIQLQKMSCP